MTDFDDTTTETELVEKDICIDCGTGIDKPKPVQLNPFMSMQPCSLCTRCEERWRWRQQICVARRPYQVPLWRPKEAHS